MKRQNRLTSETQNQEQRSGHHTEQKPATEFVSVEEMLRHDRLHTPIPPNIEQRLRQSTEAAAPRAGASWWRRIFGGSER